MEAKRRKTTTTRQVAAWRLCQSKLAKKKVQEGQRVPVMPRISTKISKISPDQAQTRYSVTSTTRWKS